jgi:hypothetical protein
MSESPGELEARRRMLILRSERLRSDLSSTFGEFETRLGGADRIFAVARGIVSPSILLSVGGLAVALLRRVRPVAWATRGFLIFSLARRILAAVRSHRPASPPARR